MGDYIDKDNVLESWRRGLGGLKFNFMPPLPTNFGMVNDNVARHDNGFVDTPAKMAAADLASRPFTTATVSKPNAFHHGKLIVFEGIDGCGKGALIKLLKEKLNFFNLTTPPSLFLDGTNPIDKQIRIMLFEDPGSKEMAGEAVDALFLAGHLHRTNRLIRPALGRGMHVVCDRYWQSAVAYPLERKDADMRITRSYADRAWPRTDKLFLLICDPEVALRRARLREDGKQQTKAWDDVKMQEKIQGHFIHLFGNRPNTHVIDTTWMRSKDIFELAVWPSVRDVLRSNPYPFTPTHVPVEEMVDIRLKLAGMIGVEGRRTA